MKSLILSIVILVTVTAITVFGAFFTSRKLDNFTKEINSAISDESTDTEAVYKGAERIEDEYDKLKKYLIFLIHDNGIDEIEEHIADIKSAARSDELSDAMTAKSRLLLHIEQLRRLSKFSCEAIF